MTVVSGWEMCQRVTGIEVSELTELMIILLYSIESHKWIAFG